MEELETVQRLTDDELVVRVRECVREDRRVSARLLAHLAEIEARGLHRDLGYESMFEYAVRGLHMSDSEAGLRLHVARFACKFPDSLDMLSRGELHLTAMKLLAPVLKPDNAELLKMACRKTKQEIQLLIAKHCPQPDVPDVMRRLPTAHPANTSATGLGHATLRPESVRAAVPVTAFEIRSASTPATQEVLAGSTPATQEVPAGSTPAQESLAGSTPATQESLAGSTPVTQESLAGSTPVTQESLARVPTGLSPSESQPFTAATPPQLGQSQVDLSVGTNDRPLRVSPASHASNREPVLPIREGRYKIQFTAGQRVHDLLQEAQDLFRNQLPNGDIEVLVERALVLLVAERKKELYAQTDKPRRSSVTDVASSKPNSRHIPNATKRRVYARDKGQCRFISPSGERCRARSRLEFHHVHPFGLGGPPTEQNIVLSCHAHNALLAERDYSREHIQRCIRASQTARTQVSTPRPSAPSKTQPAHAQPTNAEPSQLGMPQYKPTRSGISKPRERDNGLNLQLHEDATPPKTQPAPAQPTHANAESSQLGMPQYNPTRSGISKSREPDTGLNHQLYEGAPPPQYNPTWSGISEPRERDQGLHHPLDEGATPPQDIAWHRSANS